MVATVFGAGTGRCGTITFANALDAEPGVIGLHEGQRRHGIDTGDKLLPFLTLQNVAAYHDPDQAEALFRAARTSMPAVAEAAGARVIADIAYNNAPFVAAIPKVFPDARLLAIFRDGRDFVRSAYTSDVPDPMPVGWLDPDRPQTKIERYVELGRLRPIDSEEPDAAWGRMSPLEKNAWLWSETNRLILDGLAAWPADQVMQIRFEEFFADPWESYRAVRAFIGLGGEPGDAIREVFERKLNARHGRVLPKWTEWTPAQRDAFNRHALPMMQRLGYVDAPDW